MSDTDIINRGSDYIIDGQHIDEAGPVNITGATLSVFEPHATMAPHILLTKVDPLVGTFTCKIKWSDDFPHAVAMPLRIKFAWSDRDECFPPVYLRVGA